MDLSQTISAHQPPSQYPEPESGNQEGPPKETSTTFGHLEAVSTRYVNMVLHDSEPHDIFGVLAGVFMWIALAGFLVLPGSFPKLKKIVKDSGELGRVVHLMQKIPLLALGIGCCVVGGIGLLLLVAYHSGSYGWLVGNIFVPGMSSGLAGLISTLVNLYGSGERVHYDATTTVTLAVTGGCTVICGFLAVVFTALKVRAMRRHERSWRNAEKK